MIKLKSVTLTHKQFADANDKDALLGRLRINGKLRCAPPPRPYRVHTSRLEVLLKSRSSYSKRNVAILVLLSIIRDY